MTQLAVAESVMQQYIDMELSFVKGDENYDHEWHMYTLMAELSTAKKLLS